MTILSSISKWLRPVKAKDISFMDVAEFREFVMAIVRKLPKVDGVTADASDPAKFAVLTDGETSTVDVTNIFGYLKAYPEEDAERAVARFANSIVEGLSRAEGEVVAVVRNREYIEHMLSLGQDVRHKPLGADLMIVYMIDRPDSMSPINSENLSGGNLAELHQTALSNVRRWLPKIVADGQLGMGRLYTVEGNEMLSTSLIFLDEFWASVAEQFPGDVLIAIPRRDQLFVFCDDKKPASLVLVRRLIDATFAENFNLLSPLLYARRNGEIVAVPD